MKNSENLDEIIKSVEKAYKTGGLSDGLYADFAKEVATQYANYITINTLESIKKIFTEKKINTDIRAALGDNYSNIAIALDGGRSFQCDTAGYNRAIDEVISYIDNQINKP